ncbi:hypothetical protein ABZ412_34155 [Nocardia sp. NPDC005746]|uniref:Gp37-like protein n=1 Tax=Nocardia sp. NPDC005746 TaxID=3157062 RepID=UPI0033CD5CB1
MFRLQSGLPWELPADPMNGSGWTGLDQSNWQQVVKPTAIEDDHSQFAIVHSRFKYMYDVQKRISADAQITWLPRRYLDGDPPPWPGATLRHGTLVWDLVDSSSWDIETSFGGDVFNGLDRARTIIGGNGFNSGEETIPDPTFPPEYSEPGYRGTIARAPGIVLRDGDRTGIKTSSFKWKPATDVGFVVGGHSAYGVNEAISAAVNMAGDLVAAALFVPPVGGAIDAILKPLYTDTLFAYMKQHDPVRAGRLGWSHLHETLCEGSDRAYTISALLALRAGWWRTREQSTHQLKVVDGYEGLRIGQYGHGNAYLGTRIGTTVKDWGVPGVIYVDRITEITISWDRKTTPIFDLTVGHRDEEDPIVKGLEMIQEVAAIARELGML